ncbi:hypothetical protein SAMN04487861_11180 [Selenomonas ruminantium]|uniref:Lipoprotein n=1 Tax=Selenomonas ruminantium TaxID=971 RepID=A0A1I3ETE1_SELRU|nr:hypothetical protein [Selenomonas ruminantium]SFI01891.1 hypothetical protein SAMN04487861_11180 [Selenomonas ruminantium]
MKKLMFILLVVMALFVPGCSGNNKSQEITTSSNEQIQKDGWRSIELPQKDGEKLYIDLPFNLEDRGDFKINNEINNDIKSAKWYRHEDDKINVSVDWALVGNDDFKINFDIKTFMVDFDDAEQLNAKMKILEDKYINGRKVTYAKIVIDEDNNPQIIECIGIDGGNEYWTIMYTYIEGNRGMEKMVKRSMESIAIR